MNTKIKKSHNRVKNKILNTFTRFSLSAFVVASFFFTAPIFINFADKNFNNKEFTNNSKNILSIKGVEGVFLGQDFLSVNKSDQTTWDEIKHIVISFINDFYSDGKEFVIDENIKEEPSDLDEIEQKIVKILDQKIRPAVARDGGDIKFKEYKDGIVKVQLQGSCSGCPSSTMTLKQGVQNLLCHYLPEVKEVIAI